MPKFDKIVAHYIDLLDACIGRYCERESSMIGVAPIASDEFLETKFADGCTVFINLSYTELDEVLKQLFEKIAYLAKNFSPQTSRIDETKFCSYCSLAKICIRSAEKQTAEKILVPPLINNVTSISTQMFSRLPNPNSHDVQKAFISFFGVLGQNSSQIYNSCYQIMLDAFKEQSDSKQLQKVIKSFVYLSSGTESLIKALGKVYPFSQEIPDNCRPAYSQAINEMISYAIMQDPNMFHSVFDEGRDLDIGTNVYKKLYEWDKKNQGYQYIAKISTILLLPNSIAGGIYTSEFETISNGLKSSNSVTSNVETFINALDSSFLLVSETQKTQVFGKMTAQVFNDYLGFVERAFNKIMDSTWKIQKSIFVNYGLALFFYDQLLFEKKFLTLLLQTVQITKGSLFCRFISRFCKHKTQTSYPVEILRATISTINRLTIENEKAPDLRFIFKGFTSNPDFFNALMRTDHTCLTNMITVAFNFNFVQLCTALMKFFEPSRANEIKVDSQLLVLITTITNAISSLMIDSSALVQSTIFTESIPEITLRISQFVLVALQITTEDEVSKLPELKNMLDYFEIISLILMITNNSDICKTSVQIISNVLQIVHQADLFEQCTMPLEAYQTLVTNCRGRSSCHAMDTYFVASLKLVKKHSAGSKIAWTTIYNYFISMLHVIAPEIKLRETQGFLTIKKSNSVLHDELPNCFSIIMALLPESQTQVVEFIHSFLKTGEFVGQMAVECLPTALLPNFYTQITKLIQQTINEMQSQPGVFEVNAENSTYINNTMKVMRNLLKQPFYYENPVDTNIITNLTMQFTGYCNLVSINDFHILCAHLIVAMMAHYSKDVNSQARRSMTNPLGMWLSKPDVAKTNKNATTVLLDALAQLLNGLEFYDEQNIDKFHFFVNCATTCLQSQPKLKNEIQKMLTSLFRNNINIGIEHCISDCLSSSPLIRTTFLSAIAAVLKKSEPIEEQKQTDHPEDLIDVLFETKFQLIESLIDLVAFSRAEAVGVNLLEAAVSKGLQFEFMDFMIRMELRNAHEASKNAIFRGNGVASRAVGHFPRLYGQQWMTAHLRPLFEKFISQIEGGKKTQINPAKISADENIETNRANFREILKETIKTILNSFKSIPVSIIRVIQILYHRINERFDGLGIHIVFGFVFLRFILPAFSVPALVGLPAVLPDEPRNCLITISVILMAAATKGNLDEKGEHMKIFNDIAAEVHSSFQEAILALVQTDLKDAVYDEVKIDTKKVITNLETDFSALRRQLETKIAELPENDQLRKSAEKLNNIVKNVKPVSKPQASAPSNTDNSPAYTKLMNNDFKGENLEALGLWFYKETHPPSNDFNLFFLNNARLPHVNDMSVLAHHVFKTMRGNIGEYFVICDFSTFDKSNVPRPSQMVKWLEIAPKNLVDNLKAIFILNPCEQFVQFLTDCQGKLPLKKIIFPKSIQTISEMMNGTPRLSPMCAEAVSNAESIHTAKIDNQQVYCRLHEKSLQIMHNCPQITQTEAFTLQIYPFPQITKVVQINEGSFSISVSKPARQTIKFQTPVGSNFYSLLSAAVARANQKQSDSNYKVSVEQSSVQWLMLNIAFANLVSNEHDVALNYAAMQLVISTYASFDFSRHVEPTECPEHLIPPNCGTIVSSLSQDLAANNFEATQTFLAEFFKMSERISDDTIPNTIPFLAPWVENLVRDEAEKSEPTSQKPEEETMLIKIIKFYFHKVNAQNIFNSLVWSRFGESKLLCKLFVVLKELNSRSSLRLVNFIAQLNPKFSSEYWVNCFEEGEFSHNVIHSLLMADTYDIDSVPDLLFQIIKSRDKYQEEGKRESVGRLLNNLLAMLALQSTNDASELITSAVSMYSQKSVSDNQAWPAQLCKLSKTITTVLDVLCLPNVRLAIYKKFEENLNVAGSHLKFIGAIFCASLYSGNADELAKRIIQIIPFNRDDNKHVLCYALSTLTLSPELRSILLSIAIILVFTQPSRSALVLLNSVADKESLEILCRSDHAPIIEGRTGLPIQSRPIFSLSLLITAYDEMGDCSDLVLRLANEDISMKVLAVQYNPKLVSDVIDKDFGSDWPTIAAISFATFMRHPDSEETFQMIKSFIDRNPEAFGGFNGYQELDKRNVLRRINDNLKILEFGKISILPKSRSLVHKVVAQIYSDTKQKLLPEEDSEFIINSILSTI